MSSKKRLLILSNGPVPVPEQPIVEGGGLRCWGLAKGIAANRADDVEVTVAYEQSYVKKPVTKSFEGIQIATWTIHTIADVIQSYDAILVSYCMGDLSVKVAETIRDDQQLILDCYVPIYVEVSARDSDHKDREYQAFKIDVIRWQRVLQRGDLFLCANSAQKDFYRGVLAAVGRINPITYGEDYIHIVPYGVYREEPVQKNHPIDKLIGEDEGYYKVLWFGGIYPWFDIRELADAIKKVNKTIPTKLVVVGAKNPFNTHPDFVARYDKFVKYIQENDLEQYVVLQEWVNFNDRADWYLDADVVVVFNKLGEENKLAWRTRLVDFMWADLPVLTNGGDPLGEEMISNNAAVRIEDTTADVVAAAILNALKSGDKSVAELKKSMQKLKQAYYWDVVTMAISNKIYKGGRAKDAAQNDSYKVAEMPSEKRSKVELAKLALGKARKVPAYAKKHGTKATILAVNEIVRRKLINHNVITARKHPAYTFISHQLDNSGAPHVLIDMAIEFKDSGKPVEFYTYMPIKNDNLKRLRDKNIWPHILMKKEMVPSFVQGDTIILNTVSHSETTKEALFHAAETDTIKLIWYLHEDFPETLFRADEKKRLGKMLANGTLEIYIAAQKMRDNYVRYFEGDKNIGILPYRHVVPKKYHHQRGAEEFKDKLTFVLPGTVGDGRKGQLPVFYAFVEFYNNYFKKDPAKYRDFELVLIGLDKDFLSMQLRAHAIALEGRISLYGKVSYEEDLDIVSKGNMTICYSLGECLPLFVFEGMIAGHPILRNDSSGMEEQLVNGENGYFLRSDSIASVVDTLEEVLNKKKTPNEKLAKMSTESYRIAKIQETNSYLKQIEEIG